MFGNLVKFTKLFSNQTFVLYSNICMCSYYCIAGIFDESIMKNLMIFQKIVLKNLFHYTVPSSTCIHFQK